MVNINKIKVKLTLIKTKIQTYNGQSGLAVDLSEVVGGLTNTGERVKE